MLRNNRGQWSLIELLVVIVIIAVAAVVIYPRYIGSGSAGSAGGLTTGGGSDITSPLDKAKGIECSSDLGQIRAAIRMYQQSNGSFPASFSDLKVNGVTDSISKCPVSEKPYKYDASTGKVSCETPGHEGF